MTTDAEVLKSFRRTIIEMVYRAKEGHVPSAFSILEILYVLYKDCLTYDAKKPEDQNRDFFVLSKGHAGAGLYTVLSHFGFFDQKLLLNYCQAGSLFGGHPDALKVPGVEVSSGSLGHGISIAVGIALGLRLKKSERKVVVLVGDGEMDEGSFWESIMMIKNTDLKNIIVIADCNGSQKYSHKFDYKKILSAFEWDTFETQGHDLNTLKSTLQPLVKGTLNRPAFVIAQTTKGFGVKRFIGDHGWHRRTPTDVELKEIMQELQ